MSTSSVRARISSALPHRRTPELVQRKPRPASLTALRISFWTVGVLLAAAQAWAFRYYVSADSISYLDMSDGVMRGGDWHRLINGVWSPLYPFLLGLFRRSFNVSPANEIVASHVLNLAFFAFAFACFELLLRTALREVSQRLPGAPAWAYAAVAYSLFLWGSIGKITLTSLRADMLLAGFVFLPTALLLRMKHQPARWNDYCLLGAVLGVGILAKELMLPLGLFLLAATLLAVRDWRPALKMLAVSVLIFFAVGSLYFVPLSLARGRFVLGESGIFNYVVYVNQARPSWYMQDPGSASGSFLHPPEQIYSTPSAYAFTHDSVVTHPLRFDPSEWLAGVRPGFALRQLVQNSVESLRQLAKFGIELTPVIFLIALIAALSWRKDLRVVDLNAWPLWTMGLAGCALYVPLHIESRYVGAFLALACMGLLFSLTIPPVRNRWLLVAGTIVAFFGLLIPGVKANQARYRELSQTHNADAEAAGELMKLGLRPGDKVARISPTVTDLGVERITRVEVVAEVGTSDFPTFWTSTRDTQEAILNAFASHGARAVIATLESPPVALPADWIQLGKTPYWAWVPKTPN